MLATGELASAFQIYWDEIDRCRAGKTYWALLHVVVCLSDICAALQSANGETSGPLYIAWSDHYLKNPLLSGAERYSMRCKVLHQGRAAIWLPGRYTGFSFAQPAASGQVDHERVDGTKLILDVGRMAEEVAVGVERWIQYLEANANSAEANNAQQNLLSLIRVRQFTLPQSSDVKISATPVIINRSS